MSDIEYLPDEQLGADHSPEPLEALLPPPPPADSAHAPTADDLAGPQWRRRRWFVPRSLSSRIAAGVVGLVVVLVLIVGGATYYALSSFLTTRFDQQLSSTASQNVGFFDQCVRTAVESPGGDLECFGSPQTQQEWVLAYYPVTGDSYTFGPRSSDYVDGVEALKLSAAQLKHLVQNPNSTLQVTQDGNSLRVAAGVSRRDGLIVATGLSNREVTRTLHRLILVEVIIGSSAVLIAILATTYGVRFSLRRLRRVTTTAQDVAAELSPEGAGLDRRVPDDEPETEVGQLATSFNMMLAAVETQFAARIESEQRMRQFLADASHELRTPLTSIRGYAELARMQRAVGDVAEDNLDRIESEGTRMSRLVEDLLMLARDEDNDHPAQRDPLDIAELLDDVAHGSRAAFPDRPIDVEVTAMPAVLGDHDQLLRVVRNLVTNAAVHSESGRPILVRGFPAAGGVTIQVLDGGPGLSPEDAAHVFERFWRADKARTRARGGSGLGLSIVASIVRSHGGSVRFDSTVERGSTVSVWLPGAPPSATPLAAD